LQRGGWVPIPPNRSVIVSITTENDFETLDSLLLSLRQDRLSLLFVPATDEVKKSLIERFGEAAVVDSPWNNRLSSLLFLLTSRARLLVGISGIQSLPHSFVKQAYLLGIGIAVIATDMTESRGLGPDKASVVDLWFAHDARIAEALRSRGIPPDRIICQATSGSPSSPHSSTSRRLNLLMARRPPARSSLQEMILGRFDHPVWRRFLGARARRIDTLDELRAALGRPQAILCLGNGPSSEDSAIAREAHDCLFRVNHRWLERGVYCNPQMVFTGQKRTLFTLHGKPIFAFQTRRAEAHLVTHQIFNPLCRRMRFVTLERIGVLRDLDWDGVRPTNGATMLAVAVALKPKRLIVAGIDLFEDPAGPYPGDDKTPNEYVVVHERGMETEFILETLQNYRGELVIIGNVLAKKWATRSEELESAVSRRLVGP
jgi:hypothetical protein